MAPRHLRTHHGLHTAGPPVGLEVLRGQERLLMAVREDLERTHGKRTPPYFPWVPYRGMLQDVEVKRTTTDGSGIILTPNEVDHAKTYPEVALFVPADIAVIRTAQGVFGYPVADL